MNEAMNKKQNGVSAMPLWAVLLSMTAMFSLFQPPLNGILPILLLCWWCSKNRYALRLRLQGLRILLTAWFGGYEPYSLWFEHEGREKIKQVIDRLSAEGRQYCDLADELQLPPYQHYYAISKGLSDMGVLSQHTTNSFYICWNRPAVTSKEASIAK